MYRFALKPRWIAGHVLVLVLVVVMVNLGFWQLRRLDARRAHNERVASRIDAPVEPLEALVDLDAPPGSLGDEADVVFRPASATGRFDPSHEVLVRSRPRDGQPGYHVVTPLLVGDDTAVLVNRGWIPLRVGEAWPVPDAAPPTGTVEVVGIVRASDDRGRLGESPAAEGRAASVSAVDLARLADRLPYGVAPVQLERSTATERPAEDQLPAPLAPPELGEGNHLSYAGQWFIFSVIALVGWGALVRSAARDDESSKAVPRPGDATTARAASSVG